MTTINKRQTTMTGAILIALGLIWWLNLWSWLLPGALIIGGIVAYQQRRADGRAYEAVQVALWGVGLGILFLVNFFWPGILFLGGASILLRGNEARADDTIQHALTRVRPRRHTTTQHVPVETTTVTIEQVGATGDTTRL